MSVMFFDMNRDGVESDEEHVRATVTVVEDDTDAVETKRPDFNDADTDPDTGGGLTTRQLASNVTPSSQYAPFIGNANDDLNARIDDQVSTSGTAAAREATGEWGHGTLHIQDATEPTIRDGGAFGEDYFHTGDRIVQDGTGAYMSSNRYADDATASAAQELAQRASRDASNGAIYARFHNEVTR